MTQTNRNYNPAAAEASVQLGLASANDIRTGLLAQLARGDDVNGELEAIEEEIDVHTKALGRFAEARAVAAQLTSKEARQARHVQLTDTLGVALTEAAQLATLSAEVVAYVEGLGTKLQEIAALRATVTDKLIGAARTASQSAAGTAKDARVSSRALNDGLEQIHNVIDRLTAPTYVAAAVGRTGLGSVGVRLQDQFVSVHPVPATDDNYTFADPTAELTNAVTRLGEIASRLEGWSVTTNGLKE